MSSVVPPACSLQGASRASVFLMPTLSCFLFLSLQGDIRRHPSSPSHQLSPWTHQASGPQQGHTRPAARSLQQAGSFQRPFSSLALVACLAVPRWSVAVEDPGSGVLMDACLALVPTAALISSEAEVSLCTFVSCKWCQDLPPLSMAAPLSLAPAPPPQPSLLSFPLEGCGGNK